MKNQTYTLITGASSGLGREFAMQCARDGRNLLLLALPGSNLQALADNLVSQYRVNVHVFEFDLTDNASLNEHAGYIADNFRVDFLINNAGTGGTAAITETSPEHIDRIIQLNVKSTVLITRLLLPNLLKQRSFILNVSSMAAFTPIAYKTVYPASKAFISSFSLGLREEFAGTGLSVSVLYPGPIMTNSNTSLRIIHQGLKGRMGLLSATAIVKIALRRTLKGKPVIIPGIMNRINHLLMNMLPLEFKLRIVSREIRKELQYSPA